MDLSMEEEKMFISEERLGFTKDENDLRRQQTGVFHQNTKHEDYVPATGLSMLDGVITSSNKEILYKKFPGLKKNQKKKLRFEQMKGEFEEETKKLIDDMNLALEKDHQAIRENQPALYRLLLMKRVDECLRKKHIYYEFIDQGGIDTLSDWISQNPDHSFPLVQVVELVFEILDRLPIETQHLENSKIVQILSLYAKDCTGMPHLSNKALNIIQKWQAIVYNLSYKYDQEGFYDKKQRDLRDKIHAIGKNDQSNAEEELIKRDCTGQIVMMNSNFDFIEKPRVEVEPRLINRSNTAKEKINKIFQKIAKEKQSMNPFLCQ